MSKALTRDNFRTAAVGPEVEFGLMSASPGFLPARDKSPLARNSNLRGERGEWSENGFAAFFGFTRSKSLIIQKSSV